jgi:hypothetical protein
LLSTHNQERAKLNLPPLTWSSELAAGAREWSKHLADTGRFEHSPDIPGEPSLGENIWAGTTGHFGPEQMVDRWLREKQHFKPGIFPANSKTGRMEDVTHYTQIIWRETTTVGCSKSSNQDEDILVCRYSQPGNIKGSSPI